MSSRYPILDNRPIDQWKVTALKEELKRRKLTTKGLKDDLIKRLDEALRVEREANETSEKDEANEANGLDCDPQPVAGLKDSQTSTVVAEVVDTIARESAETVETAAAEMENTSTVKQVEKENTGIVEQVEKENVEDISVDAENESTKSDKLNAVSVPFDVNNRVTPSVEEVGPTNLPVSVNSASLEEELVVHGSTVETNNAVTESVTEVVVSCQETYSTEIKKDNGELASELETKDSKFRLETEDSKARLEIEDPKPHLESDLKMDIVQNSSFPENQVSEVNHSLGSQVKSDSISSDCVSINEKNELKDNIITDNVKLEQNIIRPEVVEPSPSNFVPIYGESHSMDVGELHEKKAFVEENTNNSTSPGLKKINGSEDAGYPEKLNLDRSSGDDSMEEDLPESKQFDSKFNDDELREKSKCSEMPIVKEEIGTKVVGDVLSAGKSDIHHDNDISLVVSAEKRKFHDQASVGDEPAKRLRRWNSERIKGPYPLTTTPATTPRDESTAVKHNFSRSESLATDDAPRDRIVPPPQKSPTNSLRIDRFLRPFTLKAVQEELLGKTGKVITFWMDHIKTHCYVTYSSVEEAIETRNAVYNLQWPPNGGRLLVAEYVDPEEVKLKVETPVQAAPVSSSPTIPPTQPTSQSAPSRHREQPPVQPTLPPPPPLSKIPPASRERLPPPPPLPENVDPPFVTLDDLFCKTRATPRIYYLPLSEEQVAAKLAAQGKSTKQ